MISRSRAVAELEELYAQLPRIDCKGRCWDTCTAIEASELERERLRERGVELPDVPADIQLRVYASTGNVPRCPALSSFNTCSVYAVRPFVCRAFGMVTDPQAVDVATVFRTSMMCDYGCWPEKVIPLGKFLSILDSIERLSREVTGVARRALPEDEMKGRQHK